jgi:hypothetical protein
MFCTLWLQVKIQPSFLNILTTFGYRTSDTDAHHNSVWRSCTMQNDVTPPQKVYGKFSTNLVTCHWTYPLF